MHISSIFLKEFTKQILLEINKVEESPSESKRLIQSEIKYKETINIPKLSSEIINEIENPALAPYLPEDNLNSFIETENNYQEEYDENVLLLGKLTPIVNDYNVISIECNGAGKYIILKTRRGIINTQITLTNQEIENILESFSRISMIPRIGGMFKAIAENLLVTSIESSSGNRFIISRAPQVV